MKKFAALMALALAALALVACGSSGSGNTTTSEETAGGAGAKEETSEGGREGGGGSGGTVKVEANPEGQLEFVQKSLTAKAGTDTLEFTNKSAVPHDVKIENSKGEEVGGVEITQEGTESATVELEPGEYTFFCSVPGHRQAGMEGKLIVK